MSDRIKLAEAMGAKCVDGIWHWKGSTWNELLFDPLTDANDDYAVLEWMRAEVRREGISWLNGCGLLSLAAHNYQIGDYARAALKVLENRDE